IERHTHRLGHDLSHLVIPVGDRPSAEREPAAVVLARSPRSLYDPVEGHERAHAELPHRGSLPHHADRATASIPISSIGERPYTATPDEPATAASALDGSPAVPTGPPRPRRAG